MSAEQTVDWTATKGETFAKVRVRGNYVHVYFPKDDRYIAMTFQPAIRLAYLIAKYALIGLFSRKHP